MKFRKVWQAISGEYENRCTAFVAESTEAALVYLKQTQPQGEWTLTDKMVESPTETPDRLKITPYRDIQIVNDRDPEDCYDLWEINFAEQI